MAYKKPINKNLERRRCPPREWPVGSAARGGTREPAIRRAMGSPPGFCHMYSFRGRADRDRSTNLVMCALVGWLVVIVAVATLVAEKKYA